MKRIKKNIKLLVLSAILFLTILIIPYNIYANTVNDNFTYEEYLRGLKNDWID